MESLGIGLRVNGSKEAVELYEAAFGLTLGYHVLNKDGSYFHSELYSGEKEIISVIEASETVTGFCPVQLGFQFDTQEELRKAFDILKTGGKVVMEIQELPWSPCAAEVVDRFGVNWFLSLPQHRPAEDTNYDEYMKED